MQQQAQDRWNSIESTRWAEAQERKAYGRGERRYGIYESLSAIENMRNAIKRRYMKHGGAYDFAAIAVLDEVCELLSSMEQRATAAYDYEVAVWMQEFERVSTRVLPVGGAQ